MGGGRSRDIEYIMRGAVAIVSRAAGRRGAGVLVWRSVCVRVRMRLGVRMVVWMRVGRALIGGCRGSRGDYEASKVVSEIHGAGSGAGEGIGECERVEVICVRGTRRA